MEGLYSIYVVDDHRIFRTGLEVILNGISDFKVTGSFDNGDALNGGLKDFVPDIILMDIKLPGEDGISLTRRIKKSHPQVKIIALTMFGEIEYFNEMVEAGADGFILKKTEGRELERAVRDVAKGGTYFAKEFISYLEMNKAQSSGMDEQINLSEREREVLQLICEGYSNPEIAEKLSISCHTVDGHRKNLISKTGVKNAPNLVLFAVKHRLIKFSQ